MTFSKTDIEYHSDGFRSSKPAVNVKVYNGLTEGYREWQKENADADPRFTLEWIESNLSDEYLGNHFWHTCEWEWEYLEGVAQEIWHSGVKVYSEGRSGGWAIVDGINNDTSEWDAIELGKWARFAKTARAVADGIPYSMVDSLYINEFENWKDERQAEMEDALELGAF